MISVLNPVEPEPPPPAPDPVVVAARLVLGLTIGLIVLTLLVIARLYTGSPRLRSSEDARQLTALAVTIMGPYLLSLIALAVRRSRPAGYVMAAAVGVGASVAMIPMVLYFPPYIVGPLAQLVLASVAVRGVRQTRPGLVAWIAGLVVPVVYVIVVYGPEVRRQAEVTSLDDRIAHYTRAAERALDRIGECAERYAAAHPATGIPSSLDALGPSGDGCLDARLAAGDAGGYRVIYVAPLPLAGTRTWTYNVCAKPRVFGETGRATLATSEIRRIATSGAETTSGECSGAVRALGQDTLGALEYCILDYARKHPQQGYPDHPRALRPCLSGLWHRDSLDGSFESFGTRYTYLAGAKNARGVIHTFVVYGRSTHGSGRMYLDQAGIARYSTADRLPTRRDPCHENYLPHSLDARRLAQIAERCAATAHDDTGEHAATRVEDPSRARLKACAMLTDWEIDGPSPLAQACRES
jgi:hypothetical protein